MENYFVKVSKEGNVLIEGGLIFYKGGFLYSEQPSGDSGFSHSFTNNYCITATPKWWQIVRWIRLIKLIKSFTP